jgi:hypothetical protein
MKGKKLTKQKMHEIQLLAKKIRASRGSKKVTVTKYNMKQCEAVRLAANSILKKPKQASLRFKY